MIISSASKSVKFQKATTPSSDRKKFAKTPHSSKTPAIPTESDNNELETSSKKKRKLSFSNVDESLSEVIKTPSSNKKGKPTAPVSGKEKMDFNGSDDDDVEATPSTKKKQKLSLAGESNEGQKKTRPQKKKAKLTKADLISTQERTVFVGNLPASMTTQKIAKDFSKFGKVLNTRIRCLTLKHGVKNRRAGAIMKQTTGAPISAFVCFSKVEEATEALAWNGHVIGGHHIRVDLADPSQSKPTDKNKAVFLRNLNFKLTDDELWSAFESCGKIHSVRIIKDTKNYLSRGLGYVNFTTSSAVELALKLDGTEIKGRPVMVHRCTAVVPNETNNKKRQPRQKKISKDKGNNDSQTEDSHDFSGKKSALKIKKKPKKMSAAGLKKKMVAKVLTK